MGQILIDSSIIIMSLQGENQPSEEERTIPRAALNKMIKEILPDIRVSIEAREMILACCSEFIHHIATEANTICNEQQKKTINAEHLLTALDKLGFEDYRDDAEEVFNDCKEIAAKKRKKKRRPDTGGMATEDLLKLQQELIAKAREEQMLADQQLIHEMQMAASHQKRIVSEPGPNDDEDDYS